jgi:Family of unknown function (DUF6328)
VPDNESRHDRELIELLQELRVALPGVQVLFAFLLTVPFSQGFKGVTDPQQTAYFISLCCAAIATVLFIAPTTFHRIRFRDRDKESLIRFSNGAALTATVFLALAITSALYMITDFIFSGALGPVVAALFGGFAVVLWYGVPLWRESRD